MTNAAIILNNSIELMKAGILKGTGIMMTYEDGEGNKVECEMPEAIHTFSTWKKMGFSVRKGEHAKASFSVWKYITSKKADDDEEGEADGKCYMKKAFFFTADQVQKIA